MSVGNNPKSLIGNPSLPTPPDTEEQLRRVSAKEAEKSGLTTEAVPDGRDGLWDAAGGQGRSGHPGRSLVKPRLVAHVQDARKGCHKAHLRNRA